MKNLILHQPSNHPAIQHLTCLVLLAGCLFSTGQPLAAQAPGALPTGITTFFYHGPERVRTFTAHQNIFVTCVGGAGGNAALLGGICQPTGNLIKKGGAGARVTGTIGIYSPTTIKIFVGENGASEFEGACGSAYGGGGGSSGVLSQSGTNTWQANAVAGGGAGAMLANIQRNGEGGRKGEPSLGNGFDGYGGTGGVTAGAGGGLRSDGAGSLDDNGKRAFQTSITDHHDRFYGYGELENSPGDGGGCTGNIFQCFNPANGGNGLTGGGSSRAGAGGGGWICRRKKRRCS